MADKEKKVGENKKKKGKRPRKLTPREIERAIEKIRKSYDDYMVRYMQNRRARDAFEQRYIDARKARVELDRFIADELAWVRRLQQDAEQEKRRAEAVQRRRAANNGKAQKARISFADRVIATLRSRIEGYPPIGLEAEEVFEVDQLFGALGQFERSYWPKLDRMYRKIYPSRYSGPRIILESRLFELAATTSGRLPVRLQVLSGLLGRFPRNYKEIEWEVKQCILSASFFLHMLCEELEKLRDEEQLAPEERGTVEKALDFVHTVIEDFRLTDLKEGNL